MYNFNFYLCILILAFVIALPCVLIISLSAWLSAPKQHYKITLEDFKQEAKMIQDIKSLKKMYQNFYTHFLKSPANQNQEWLECISALAAIEIAGVDEVVEFKEHLEKHNEKFQKEIANIIAVALKNKKR